MAEHPNALRIRRAYDALAVGDVAVALGQMSPRAVLHFNGTGPLGGDHVGPDAIAAALVGIAQYTAGTQKIEVHRVFADDMHGIVLLRESGSRPDGATLSVEEAHVLSLDGDGLITDIWDVPDDPDSHDRFFDGR
jgi:ketosteroid isomerase-like protein